MTNGYENALSDMHDKETNLRPISIGNTVNYEI